MFHQEPWEGARIMRMYAVQIRVAVVAQNPEVLLKKLERVIRERADVAVIPVDGHKHRILCEEKTTGREAKVKLRGWKDQ